MAENLNQLKKELKKGLRFEITGHCRPECIGQIRRVNLANTQGFYSVMDGQPEHKVSLANNCRGSYLGWSGARFWSFRDGLCAVYSSDREHTRQNLIMEFRVLKEASERAGVYKPQENPLV